MPKRCAHANCSKQPIYGVSGSRKAEYCVEHKPDGYVDVKNKQCADANCNTRPWYGIPGSTRTMR